MWRVAPSEKDGAVVSCVVGVYCSGRRGWANMKWLGHLGLGYLAHRPRRHRDEAGPRRTSDRGGGRMRRMRTGVLGIATVLLLGCTALLGCVGGRVDVISGTPEYEGRYSASFTLVSDECGLVAEGEGGFSDSHTITQSGTGVVISSDAGFVLNIGAEIDEDGGFVASEQYTIQEPGFAPCDAESALSYERPVFDDSQDEHRVTAAESVFVFRLACLDGYVCETRAIGYVERIP